MATCVGRIRLLFLPLLIILIWGCGSEETESGWTGIITGQVVGDDVGPEIELSSIAYFCMGGRAFESFARRPEPDGSFRIMMFSVNTGATARCFDVTVGRDGAPFDTLKGVGPVNFFSDPPLDSLFLRIRVFGSDSALVVESFTLPGGGS
jgi:hypothetical protein